MKAFNTLSISVFATMLSASAGAEMLWSDFSLTYLNGDDYEVGDPEREVITVEHASGHSWGDNFLFIDQLKSEDGTNETYAELAPRLSLSYLTDSDLSAGPVKDLFIATTWENGEGFDNLLYGIGVSLDIPGFNYFTANLYRVNNDTTADNEQLTLTWGYPFSIGSAEFLYDGFLDWSSAASGLGAEMNFTSQLKWNFGKLFGTGSPLYLGVEYAYWNNKFGIKGVNERNPALLLKWHF